MEDSGIVKETEGGSVPGWEVCVYAHEAYTVSREGVREQLKAVLVREVPFTIWLNGLEVVTLLCTGLDLECLAVGFLKSEGLLKDRSALTKVEIDREGTFARIETTEDTGFAASLLGKRTVTSGCGKGSTFYNSLDALAARKIQTPVTIAESQVRALMGELNNQSELYRVTHGVHNCGLAKDGELILFRADIGRHNALDMIIGTCFLEGVETGDKALLTTGRVTSEILIKAAKVGLPLIISRSSATSMAVNLARELNITVIGRVRAGSFVIYNGWENVVGG